MICPILSEQVYFDLHNTNEMILYDCQKEQCQWWVTDLGTNQYGNCAIHQIARALQMNHDTPA